MIQKVWKRTCEDDKNDWQNLERFCETFGRTSTEPIAQNSPHIWTFSDNLQLQIGSQKPTARMNAGRIDASANHPSTKKEPRSHSTETTSSSLAEFNDLR